MRAVFVELPAFERHRSSYLDDEAVQALQKLLMKQPEAGDPIQDTVACASYGSLMRGEAKVNAAGCG